MATQTTDVPQLLEVADHLDFPAMEVEMQKMWERVDAFKTSLKKSEGRPKFSFYDGPPFATGLPHYGHILAGSIKDVVCRYAHQTGHHVERRFGWDCHGLPVEFEIEKALGIKSSHDVMAMGIDKYNAECRKIVLRYAGEWEVIMTRMGRWIDFKNDYKTMNIDYMESVWWVFRSLFDKGLVYRGFKVMPFSTACTTPLSNFESNMNYKDVSDPSATVSFPIVGDESTHLLAWTTTPWTLPSNLCLCVKASMDYVLVVDAKTSKRYILAECRLGEVYKNYQKAATKPFEIEKKMKGSDLVGMKYVPLFPYFQATMGETAFRVVADDYVTDGSGVGIVHCAPGFGEEDFRVCRVNGIIGKTDIVCPVDENGRFTAEVTDFAGRYIKDCDDEILARLKADGRLVNKAAIVHSYPFCWRSETPLIYKAVSSWFVGVESIREKVIKSTKETRWVPEFVQTKRFQNWLEDAKDWAVSRNRYWGTPLPLWVSEDGEEVVCVGSVKELEELTGTTGITDIHRDSIDHLTIPSKRPGQPPLKRVSEVFDCWFESGSMPYAQQHYPFENKAEFEETFPANFIAEGLDQTRGWFYTLMVLSSALFDGPPFKNLVVNGLVLAEDGKKMSKRLKNYPEVMEVVNQYGADAIRLYLINSPVVRAEPLRFKLQGVKDVVKDVFLPLFNAMKFFVMNANRYLRQGGKIALEGRSTNLMDRWIMASTQTFVGYVHGEMAGYRLYTVLPGVLTFLENLTNWYVRMNRRRLKGSEGDEDWAMSLSTLYQVLFVACRMCAPFMPFMAESLYQHLKGLLPDAEDSVHYLMLPQVDKSHFDDDLERSLQRMITVVDLVRVLRDRVSISLKTPVKEVVVIHPDQKYLDDLQPLVEYIKTEVNCFELNCTTQEGEFVVTSLEGNMKSLGKRFNKEGPTISKAIKALSEADVRKFLQEGKITVNGHELTQDDVKVSRSFRPGIENYETNTDNNVLVLLDKRSDKSIIESGQAREFVNRIQRLRKSAGLVVEDVVEVYYDTKDAELLAALVNCAAQVNATVKSKWTTIDQIPAGAEVVAKQDCTIGDAAIAITFTKPSQ